MDASAIFSGIQTTQNVIDSWINNGLNIANHNLSKRQLQLQEKAHEYQKYYDANQTQIRVDDYAKAGLNPILAGGSAGASAVSGVSASPSTPTANPGNDFQGLIDTLLQKEQLKQQKDLARERNAVEKEMADEKNQTEENVAQLQAETARLNAALNAQTQTNIAASNNEALSELRSAQSRYHNASAADQERKTVYNLEQYLYDGTPKTPAEFAANIGEKLVKAGMLYVEDLKKWKDWFISHFHTLNTKLKKIDVKSDKSWYED